MSSASAEQIHSPAPQAPTPSAHARALPNEPRAAPAGSARPQRRHVWNWQRASPAAHRTRPRCSGCARSRILGGPRRWSSRRRTGCPAPAAAAPRRRGCGGGIGTAIVAHHKLQRAVRLPRDALQALVQKLLAVVHGQCDAHKRRGPRTRSGSRRRRGGALSAFSAATTASLCETGDTRRCRAAPAVSSAASRRCLWAAVPPCYSALGHAVCIAMSRLRALVDVVIGVLHACPQRLQGHSRVATGAGGRACRHTRRYGRCARTCVQ